MGGGGGLLGGLFGGSKSSAPAPAPAPIIAEPVPVREAEAEPESKRVRDEETRKLKQRKGLGGTVLTSPLGTLGTVAGAGSSLLGRNGS